MNIMNTLVNESNSATMVHAVPMESTTLSDTQMSSVPTASGEFKSKQKNDQALGVAYVGSGSVLGSAADSDNSPLSPSTSLSLLSPSISLPDHECDIGKLITAGIVLSQLPRDRKYSVLKTEPSEDASTYPRTRPCESGSYRQFQPSWLKNYPWLHYSCFSDGAFCRACAFFAPDRAGGRDLGYFVTKPFRAWIRMSEKAGIHARKDYHLVALSKMEEFLSRHENPSKAVDVLLHTKLQETMEQNQHVIESLLKVVIFCAVSKGYSSQRSSR